MQLSLRAGETEAGDRRLGLLRDIARPADSSSHCAGQFRGTSKVHPCVAAWPIEMLATGSVALSQRSDQPSVSAWAGAAPRCIWRRYLPAGNRRSWRAKHAVLAAVKNDVKPLARLPLGKTDR